MQGHFQTDNQALLHDLMEAMTGEYNAIHFYEQLAELSPNDATKQRILEIRKDEMRHFQMFSSIYSSFTGQRYLPTLTESRPKNFKAGVRTAFHDEQNAVEFYHRVARNTVMPYIQHVFQTTAADEQNHAVWFFYFMHNEG